MLYSDYAAFVLLLALAIDAAFGDPDWLWRRLPHPVVIIGWLIDGLDWAFNRGKEARRRRGGILAVAFLIAICGGIAFALNRVFTSQPLAFFLEIPVVAILLAQNSLYTHVARVEQALRYSGLRTARRAVSMIVGRDTEALDEAGVSRAAIETTAENFSDGIVAPAFWYLVAGLPGLLIYKAVNTADSMIGHKTPRHKAFGWAAARLDDWLNFIPARIAGGLIVAAAFVLRRDWRGSWRAMQRDARLHNSPNAGWPEAAMAGALRLALAGPRVYPSGPVDDPWMNATGRKEAGRDDVTRAMRLLVTGCGIQALAVAMLALAASRI